MASWSKDIEAHVATWMAEMVITDLGIAFSASPALTMSQLTQQVPGAGSTINSAAVDTHMAAFFGAIKLYSPKWQGVTYEKGQETVRSVMVDPDKTLEDLANAVDSVLLFHGEIEGDYA